MSVSITNATNIGISLRINSTVVYFYPTKVTAYINMSINDQTQWTVGKTANLVLTPVGTTYASSVSIPLYAIAASNDIPIINVNTGTITKKSATFNMKCS
jgi:hypothetical protein